jgi:hypothetical protein
MRQTIPAPCARGCSEDFPISDRVWVICEHLCAHCLAL